MNLLVKLFFLGCIMMLFLIDYITSLVGFQIISYVYIIMFTKNFYFKPSSECVQTLQGTPSLIE